MPKIQRALVLGLGESGLAMARWLTHQGVQVRVADTRAAPPFATELARTAPRAQLLTGVFEPSLLTGIELLALSPGLSRAEAIVVEAQQRAIPLTGEIELFADALRKLSARADARIVAITGTNGKTTVTTLVGDLCRAGGLDTEVAGNISPAALAALLQRLERGVLPQVWVLELSSFQLETTATLDADAATVLNVSDDHLDRYAGIDDYAAAKARIFQGRGVQILNRQDARVAAMRQAGRKVLSFGLDRPAAEDDFGIIDTPSGRWLAAGGAELMALAELPLAGLHNAANALAALALCRAIGLPLAPLLGALRAFKGLPHRVERVAEIAGVSFYDDSKGTNVGATVAALEGLGRQVVLIAGGDGKGQDFAPLRPAVERHARGVVLIGRDAPLIEAALAHSAVPRVRATDMDGAVRQAFAAARPGDAVLLSPACASLDMYRNYAHRAEIFVAAVRALTQGEAS